MVTAVAPQSIPARSLPGRRYDNRFVSFMVALMLATVFYGFARTYFLAGVFHAPLPSTIIHVHGAIFVGWMLLLIIQTSLVSVRRVDIHRKLGFFGMGWACLMLVVGVLAATDALSRHFVAPKFPLDPATFYSIPMGDMLVFSVLIAFAYRLRKDAAAHKRLILIATIGLLDAAIARWPIPFLQVGHIRADLVNYSFLLLVVLYDLYSTRKVHRVTIWASLFLIVVQQLRVPVGMSAPWHAFAAWMLTHVR